MIKKLTFLVLLTSIAGLLACKKEIVAPLDIPIEGYWRWESSSGGIAGVTIKADQENQKTISFDKNGIFQESINNELKFESNYSIEKGKSITSADSIPLIKYTNSSRFNQSFMINGNSLVLFDEVYDGFTHSYQRILFD